MNSFIFALLRHFASFFIFEKRKRKKKKKNRNKITGLPSDDIYIFDVKTVFGSSDFY